MSNSKAGTKATRFPSGRLLSILLATMIVTMVLPQVTHATIGDMSPFGIIDMKTGAGDEMYPLEIGVKWGRGSGKHGLKWDMVETTSPLGDPGRYDWTGPDEIARFYFENGIDLVWTISPFNSIDQGNPTPTGRLPNDLVAYATFIEELAERYDGDGYRDAAGSPIVDHWQIHNEVDVGHFWSDTPENYALLYTTSHDAILSANPDAKVALSGMSSPSGLDTFDLILAELSRVGARFDVFDLHWYGFVGNYETHHLGDQESLADFVNVELAAALGGFSGFEVWVTECGTHSGTDVQVTSGLAPPQSEVDQASELVKRYVHFLANDVRKVFWLTIEETASYSIELGQNDYFDNIGMVYNGVSVIDGELIYDPSGVGEDLGEGVEKLSYHTYRRMTETLEGSDWNAIECLVENVDDTYAYRFVDEATGRPTVVAWWDWFDDPAYADGDSMLITLTGLAADQVSIMDAVPSASVGIEVVDYGSAFREETVEVSAGSVSFYLKQRPVYVTVSTATSAEDGGEVPDAGIRLNQNYPNPFNPSTEIRYALPVAGEVKLKVFNLKGQIVSVLVDERQDAGAHWVSFDAGDIGSGVYLYSLEVAGTNMTRKMTVSK